MSEQQLIGLLIAVIEFGTLLYLAALGELIAEKAGVLNLGVEGMMAFGGMAGFWFGIETGSPWLGLVMAAVAGGGLALIHAIVSVVMGADQVVSGLALTILGLAMSAFLGTSLVTLTPSSKFTEQPLGPLSDIPILGDTLFSMSLVSWLAVFLGVATWFILERTRIGLSLRAVGENAATADSAGIPVVRARLIAVVIGGALAGISGAYLTMLVAPGWSEGTTAGRGWIAVALVIFGAWRPGRLLVGALLFGGLIALEPRLQTVFDVDFDVRLLSMLPYLLTVAVLIVLSIRSRNRPSAAPAAIGQIWRREER
ncbi:MAG: ABC transporter permease [Actinomycetota bacterium]